MTQDYLPPSAATEPSMELLDGDATAAPAANSSMLVKLARGTMYGVVLLAATALLAVSAVPELARYASFVPDAGRSSCGAASGCTTLDNVNFEDTACSAVDATMASASGCCPMSAGDSESLLVSTKELPACCATISRASLLAGTKAACEAGSCSSDALANADQPIDAGSLLAATDEPAKEQADEDGAVLEEDDNNVEE